MITLSEFLAFTVMYLIFLHSEDNKSLLLWRHVMTSLVFVSSLLAKTVSFYRY